MWTPLWEQLVAPSDAEVETAALWFEPQAQARYEERRLAREIDRAHVQAEDEARQRANEIAEADRKHEEERRAAEEQVSTQAMNRKTERDREWIVKRARELAPARAKDQAGLPQLQSHYRAPTSHEDPRRREGAHRHPHQTERDK